MAALELGDVADMIGMHPDEITKVKKTRKGLHLVETRDGAKLLLDPEAKKVTVRSTPRQEAARRANRGTFLGSLVLGVLSAGCVSVGITELAGWPVAVLLLGVLLGWLCWCRFQWEQLMPTASADQEAKV